MKKLAATLVLLTLGLSVLVACEQVDDPLYVKPRPSASPSGLPGTVG